ncbi:MAG: hypothetical protein HQL97_15190 [Magnetococcales bacterium]|nr:hypothetical protein [Magnetococcales bacterium]
MSRAHGLTRTILALFLLTVAAPGWTAVDHGEHQANPKAEAGVTLNNGKPWPTDAPLRKGMEAIQRDMREALPRIHAGTYAARNYASLSKKIRAHLNHVTRNCKLKPEADLQLHRILVEILHGSEALEAKQGQSSGAAIIVRALDLYGRHFDHPGWKPLAH